MTNVVDRPVATGHPAASTGRGFWRRRSGQRTASLLFGLGLVAIWDLAVRTGFVEEIILPYPQDVVDALLVELTSSIFWDHFRVTTIETLSGFGIGSVVGFVLGAVLGMSACVRAVLFPYVFAFQGLPKVVLAPVFSTALGFGLGSKIAMAVAMAFFPVLLNTMVGILAVDRDQVRVLSVYGATGWQRFVKLTLPSAAPMISAGLKASLTFALIGAIVGEFVGASAGLGFLLNSYAYQLRIPEVWAVMAMLALLGVVLYWLIDVADRKIIFWTEERELSKTA